MFSDAEDKPDFYTGDHQYATPAGRRGGEDHAAETQEYGDDEDDESDDEGESSDDVEEDDEEGEEDTVAWLYGGSADGSGWKRHTSFLVRPGPLDTNTPIRTSVSSDAANADTLETRPPRSSAASHRAK